MPPWEALKAPGAQHTAAGHRRGSIADPLTRSGYGEKRVTLSAGDSFGEVRTKDKHTHTHTHNARHNRAGTLSLSLTPPPLSFLITPLCPAPFLF